ncbi:hypothetical protein T01_6610 [Trichinella spiralis]|uniref:MULE transposase domain-containing protein n=1 Tax=Trichinella spiralis TaxID=6334 RepID=A0A0V1BXH1_TRISP|nr:hypothetical protein T01_6610 [Trichinella spiralis]
MYHSPANCILIFATEADCLSWNQQLFTLHVFMRGKLLQVVHCLTVRKDLSSYIWIFELLHSKVEELGFQVLIRRNLFVIQDNLNNSLVQKCCASPALECPRCGCADQQPSGMLTQSHEQKSTSELPGILSGKTETVVRRRGSVRRSAAYGIQQTLHRNEISMGHVLRFISYFIPASHEAPSGILSVSLTVHD